MTTSLQEFKLWRQTCEENPELDEAMCHRFMKKKVKRGPVVPRPGATSTVPETPGRGADVVIGDVSKKRKQVQSVEGLPAKKVTARKVSDEDSKKRKQGQSGENEPAKKVRGAKVSNEEAKEIIGRMSKAGQEMISAFLPRMIRGLQKQDKPWEKFKNENGGDFTEHGFLATLVRSKGLSTMYNAPVREKFMEHHPVVTKEFFKVFPTFSVLNYRKQRMKIDWPDWWPRCDKAKSSGTESGGTESSGTESSGTESVGAKSSGTESSGAESSADSVGAESEGAESGGAESGGAESQGAESQGAESSGTE